MTVLYWRCMLSENRPTLFEVIDMVQRMTGSLCRGFRYIMNR